MKQSKRVISFIIILSVVLIAAACSGGADITLPSGAYDGYGTLSYYYTLGADGAEIPLSDAAGKPVKVSAELPSDYVVYAKAMLSTPVAEGALSLTYDSKSGVIAPSECKRNGTFEYWYALVDGAEVVLSNAEGRLTDMAQLPLNGAKITTIYAKTYTPVGVVDSEGNAVAEVAHAYYDGLFSLTEQQLTAVEKAHYKAIGFTATINGETIRLNGNGQYENSVAQDSWLFDCAQTVVFTPEYAPLTYTLVLNSGSMANDVNDMPERLTESVTYGEAMPQLRVPSRIGYSFIGWQCVLGDGAVLITDKAATYLTGFEKLNEAYLYSGSSVGLQPRWQKVKYTLRYFALGEQYGEAQTLEYTVALVPPTTAPTQAGYTFSGWYTASTGGTEVDLDTAVMPAMDLNLYAVFSPNVNTLRLNGNGGVTASGDSHVTQRLAYGKSAAITLNPFTRIGYSFSGWATTSGGEGQISADGALYEMGVAPLYELYAVWSANVYSVGFNAGGGTGAAMRTLSLRVGQSLALPKCSFSRLDKSFIGWAWSVDAPSAVYLDEAEFILSAPIITEHAVDSVLMLYALWGTLKTTVTFDANGGTVIAGQTPLTTQKILESTEDKLLYPNTFEKAGYRFGGWLRESDLAHFADGAPYTLTAEAEVTLVAQWLRLYTVTYLADGGTGTAPTESAHVKGESFTVAENTFEKNNFDFDGWWDGATKFAEGDLYVVDTSNVTLTARWINYAATYLIGTGDGGTAPEVQRHSDGTLFILPNCTFTKTGFAFAGWTDGNEQYSAGASYAMPKGGVTFTAVWSSVFSVTYNGNGATGTAPTEGSHAVGESFTLAANAFTKVGFDFDGWWDGTNTYSSGDTFVMPAANVVLTAVWVNYSVTYSGGDGATGIAPIEANKVSGAGFILAENTFSKSNFSFEGWHDGTTLYQAGESYTVGKQNVTLTARWINYSVAYEGGEGASGTAPTESNKAGGAAFTLAENPFTLTGKSFLGWSDGQEIYPAGGLYTVEKSNVSLSAVWYDGTGFTPVWTAAQLNAVRENLSGKYVLMANIDLNSAAWTPIGSGAGTQSFSGVFDGYGHTIGGFTVNSFQQYVGLFGFVTGKLINLGIINYSISISGASNSYVGGLAGFVNAGSVAYCYATGSLSVTLSAFDEAVYVYVGGLVGSSKVALEYCYATGSVTATAQNAGQNSFLYGGGLTGSSQSLTSCYAVGNVSLTSHGANQSSAIGGGLTGKVSSAATVSNSFAVGDVFAEGFSDDSLLSIAGGLVGNKEAETVILNCYRGAEQVIRRFGGAVGGSNEIGTATACANLQNASFVPDTAGFSYFISLQDLAVNPANTWLYYPDVYPRLHYEKPYSVFYRCGDGITGDAPTAASVMGGASVVLQNANCTKEGYSFIGWTDGAKTYPSGAILAMPYENVELTALWYQGENYLPIWTAAQLSGIRDSLSANYVLADDIDLHGAEWAPIGTGVGALAFSGNFDGLWHTVQGFSITTGAAYVGLFGVVTGNISNLGLEDFTIDYVYSKETFVGALSGKSTGNINGCYAVGTIKADTSASSAKHAIYAGGLVGTCYAVSDCYAVVDLTLLGPDSKNNEIYAGGVASECYGSIRYSYATGSISAGAYYVCAGGLVASFKDTSVAEGCFAGVSFLSTSSNVRKGAVYATSGGAVNNCRYAEYNSIAGEGKVATVTQLSAANWYAAALGFSAEVWSFETGKFPTLKTSGATPASVPDSCPLGSIGNPYPISTAAELMAIQSDKCYVLLADIALNSTDFSPLCSTVPFSGMFDGGGKTISNFDIVSCSTYMGLFGLVSGVVKNLNVSSFTVNIQNANATSVYVGAIAANVSYGVLDGCSATGTVLVKNASYAYAGVLSGYVSGTIENCCAGGSLSIEGNRDVYAGGIAGTLVYGNAIACVSSAAVSAASTESDAFAGGLIGKHSNGIVRNCLAGGNVTTVTEATPAMGVGGGLIGSSDTYSFVTVSYATGTVTVSSADTGYAGGLIGYVTTGSYVKYSYATGAVYGTGANYAYTGGLVGYLCLNSSIYYCYATGDVTATATVYNAYAGGLVGNHSGGAFVGCFAAGDVIAGAGAAVNCFVGGMFGDGSANLKPGFYSDVQVLTAFGETVGGNALGISTAAANLQSQAFLTDVVGFGQYLSAEDLALNPANVWVFSDEAYPTLYH